MTATEAPEAPERPDAERLDDGRVRCSCGAVVKPTRRGGSRPRPHLRIVEVLDEDSGTLVERRQRCTVVHPTETICKRCGGDPDAPTTRRWVKNKGFTLDTGIVCRSPVFHPDQWRGKKGERFGNAAAAGAVLGVSGEYFEYILRRYGEGAASRPPEPVGIDLKRRCLYWDLDAVAAFDGGRPGLTASAERLAELRRTAQPVEPPSAQGGGDQPG